MQVYRSKETGATFYAETPTDASLEFLKEAEKYSLFLFRISHVDIYGDKEWTKPYVYFANEGYTPICSPEEYLLLPTDPAILKKYGKGVFRTSFNNFFKEQYEPVNSSTTPAPTTPEPVQKPSLIGKSFYLDAGHGGSDPGAVNNNLGLQEKIAALDICLKLGLLLEKQGANVYYSRTGDTYPTITARANEANKLNVTAFISIHLNSADNKAASGIETLVYSTKGTAYELAGKIQKNMVDATKWTDRGIKARPDLGVLRLTKMPADLIECGFISNDKEATKLFKPEIQDKIANAIADGIIEQFGN